MASFSSMQDWENWKSEVALSVEEVINGPMDRLRKIMSWMNNVIMTMNRILNALFLSMENRE